MQTHDLNAKYGHAVKVNLHSGGYCSQLYAIINTVDKITLLQSMTDFESMTPPQVV